MLTIRLCGSFYNLTTLWIKAHTVVDLAPFSANWATVNPTTGLWRSCKHMSICFIASFLFVCKQDVTVCGQQRGRKQGRLCCLWSVAGAVVITWQPGWISKSKLPLRVAIFRMCYEIRLKDCLFQLITGSVPTTDMHLWSVGESVCTPFAGMSRKARLWRRASTPELDLNLLDHLWHPLMTLICNLTSWALPDCWHERLLSNFHLIAFYNHC